MKNQNKKEAPALPEKEKERPVQKPKKTKPSTDRAVRRIQKPAATSTSAASKEAKPEAPKKASTQGRRIVKKSPEKKAPEKALQKEVAPKKPTPRPTNHTDRRIEPKAPESQQGRPQQQNRPQQRPLHNRNNSNAPRNNNRYMQRPNNRDQHEQRKMHEPRKTLDEMSLNELLIYARRLGIVGATLMRKEKLVERIKYVEAHPEMELAVEGVLERLPDGFGFLRSAQFDYISGPDDVYVSPSQIRRFSLRTGDTVTGIIRKPKENEKYFALLKVKQVNYEDPTATGDRMFFDRLTPLHPREKFNLEYDPTVISTRTVDMFAPIGKGQRGLIVAPPKVGKTVVLKQVAQSFTSNYPDVHLIVLLVDERPEEVTDMRRTVKGTTAEVISSTFDESAERHVQVAEVVLAKAKRLVESGKDVVILLDSITRLARAYNTTAPASGKVLTGGIDANALQRPKRFFGAARNTEEAGSLTIIATAMVDTGSRMDEVIYEEFKGTGNMEMHMTRKLSNRRIYPAFDLLVSGTRREDLLLQEDDLKKIWVLQKFLSTMSTIEGMEFLIDKLKKIKTNREFLDSIQKKLTKK